MYEGVIRMSIRIETLNGKPLYLASCDQCGFTLPPQKTADDIEGLLLECRWEHGTCPDCIALEPQRKIIRDLRRSNQIY